MPVKSLDKRQIKVPQQADATPDQVRTNSRSSWIAQKEEGLPAGWKRVKLGGYVISVKGKKPKRVSPIITKECTIPYINIKAFEKNQIAEYTDGVGCAFCEDGDFLMVWDGSRSGYVGKAIKGALGSTLVKLDFPDINNNYAYYFLQSKFIEINTRAKGVGIPHVDPNILWNYDLLIPPKEIQEITIAKIEELFSELDKGIQQLKTAQQQLRIYRQAVLNNIIKDTNPTEIGSIIESLDQGWSPKCHNEPSQDEKEWAVIKTTAIQKGSFHGSQNKRLPKNLKPREQHELKKGDLLITRAGPKIRVGICCLVRSTRPKLLNCDKVYRIRVNHRVALGEYIELLLNSEKYTREIEKLKTGISDSGVNLTQSRFLKILIPVPSVKVQREIIDQIENRLSVCDKLEETINSSLNQAEALRQSILKKAFDGKLLSKTEIENIDILTYSIPEEQILKIAAEPKTKYEKKIKLSQIQFPKIIDGIKTTDLHAGILAMVIDAHEKSPKHHMKLSHVKGEKIAHLVEAHVGIDLGRVPKKDAAGPDDFPHLKKVEHRAKMANWFGTKKLEIGYTYSSKQGLQKVIARTKGILSGDDLIKVENLITAFLPFDLEESELRATLYAGWNNLLLEGKNPTDEEIVYESRENWSERKLTIKRESFFKVLKWMKEHGFVPKGKGKKVAKQK